MLKTLKSRIMVVVAGIVTLTLVTIIVIVQVETEKAIFLEQDEMTKNLLHTVLLNVENEYKSLLFHRNALLERRKAELKNVSGLGAQLIESYYQQYQQGLLSATEAQRQAIKEIKDLRYDNGVGYIWINDMGQPIPRMIMHPTLPELDGQLLDDPKFNCALGQKKNLFQAFVDACVADGEGYVDYLWPKPLSGGLSAEQPKLSHVRLLKEWNWVVGTGLYIDDIENDSQKRLDAILVELKHTFSGVKVANSGYMYLFTGDMKMLIHPSLEGADFSQLRNPVTGNPILADLARAAKQPNQQLDYLWEKPPTFKGQFKFWKRSYVAYFQPLDWYIASSVYFDEKEMSANLLKRKLFYLSLSFLFIALILSLLLSKNLTLPLRKLISAAQKIKIDGTTPVRIPISGTIETRELGQILDQMIDSLRNAVYEKESLLTALGERNQDLKNANRQLEEEIKVRRNAEAIITSALKEKEVLLREVHHRVKNNMAVIISLLGLQSNYISDERVRNALEDSRSRIKSMALIHESLYRSESIAEISLKVYAENLVQSLMKTLDGLCGAILTSIESEEIFLSIDQAVPFGLVLNELITNALKYAFPHGRKGLITIKALVNQQHEIVLEVCDNGIGLPPSLDYRHADTFGMKIISLLVENQLEGGWSMKNDNGACFIIHWPLFSKSTKGM
ncbi:MAG: cache domain-containing protein [Proteobacteria bacterium]|nr:cache domain-containing protein [Pseudomonadota bacterium]